MHSFLRVLEELTGGGDEGPFLMSTVDTIAAPGAFASFAASSRELAADVALAVAQPGDDLEPLLARMTPGTSRIEALGDSVRLTASAEAAAVGRSVPRMPKADATGVTRAVPLSGDTGLRPGGDVWAT